MGIKFIRVPEAYAILIANYPLNLKEITTAVEHKKKTGRNPEGISVLLYTNSEKELAKQEYCVLSGKPLFVQESTIFDDSDDNKG